MVTGLVVGGEQCSVLYRLLGGKDEVMGDSLRLRISDEDRHAARTDEAPAGAKGR
jgi:hypothetical protein